MGCPVSGKPLRLKDLTPINFKLSGDVRDGAGMYCCSVTAKPITHQVAYLLKPSGHVVLEDTYKRVVKPENRCPISGKKLGPKDVLKLKSGGTGFCSHNEVESHTVAGYTGLGHHRESDGRLLKGACGGTGRWL